MEVKSPPHPFGAYQETWAERVVAEVADHLWAGRGVSHNETPRRLASQ